MNNEHNAVNIKLGEIQDIWIEKRKSNPDKRLFSLISKSKDYPLVEGFLRLESSPYGKTPDNFVVFFIDFVSKVGFYYDLIKIWLDTFEEDAKKNPSYEWSDFTKLKEEFSCIPKDKENKLKEFYLQLLISFQEFQTKYNNELLVISLITKKVSDPRLFNEALKGLVDSLPKNTSLLVYEYKERNLCDEMMTDKKGLLIEIPSQDISNLSKQLATQGNPNDPKIRYKELLFKLGESSRQNNRKKTLRIGDEFIETGKRVGNLNLYAASYLIFPSFLFQFKKEKEKIHQLLDKGTSIVKPLYKTNKDCSGLFLQFILFKASYCSIIGESKQSIKYFTQYINYAKELDEKMQVATGYNYLLSILLKKNKAEYKDTLEEAFQYVYALDDSVLSTVNISLIADGYIKKIINDESKKSEISDRMIRLYGEDWELKPKEISRKMMKEYQIKNTQYATS